MAPEIKARNRRRSGPYGKVSQRRARASGACEATGDFFRSLLGRLRPEAPISALVSGRINGHTRAAMHASPSFVFALALGLGVAGQLVARHLRVPSIVLLLAAGVLFGPDGLGWIEPRALGEKGLFGLVSLAVAVILFEGGLNLDLRALRRAATPIRRLVTLGALVTTVGGAIAAHAFMGWGDPRLAILFGTLVIVTGPTVIRPLLRNMPLRPKVATVLEAEGLLIDPVGAIVAGVALQLVVLDPGLDSLAALGTDLLSRVAFGTVAGLTSGFALAGLLRFRRLVPEGLENLVALGGALVVFEVCESLLTESGILAVTLAGVVVGNIERHVAEELGEFQEHLTVGLIGLLFVLLAADVRLSDIFGLGMPGLMTVAALAFVVRPLNIALCTLGSDLNWRERALLSWVAPRGVVAAAIASLAAAFLQEENIPGSEEIRALVFLTIGATVVIQGGTAPLVARLLKVRAPGRQTPRHPGRGGARLHAGGDRGACRRNRSSSVTRTRDTAETRRVGTTGWSGAMPLEERTIARLRLEQAQGILAMTSNNEVNQHFVSEAAGESVPQCFAAIGHHSHEVSARIVQKLDGRVLFDGPKDVERWNVRLRHGNAEAVTLRFTGDPQDTEDSNGRRDPDPGVILAIQREDRREVMFQRFEPSAGDLAFAVLHTPEREEAEARWARQGLEPRTRRRSPGR